MLSKTAVRSSNLARVMKMLTHVFIHQFTFPFFRFKHHRISCMNSLVLSSIFTSKYLSTYFNHIKIYPFLLYFLIPKFLLLNFAGKWRFVIETQQFYVFSVLKIFYKWEIILMYPRVISYFLCWWLYLK